MIPVSNERNAQIQSLHLQEQWPLREINDSRPETEKIQRSLDHMVTSKIKEVFKE